MAASKSPLQKLFTWLWRKPWFRRFFYNAIGLVFRRQRGWQMMNCGFLPPEGRQCSAEAGEGGEALGLELYQRLVRETPLAGKAVLEIGSGRGGGSRFLHRVHSPARMVGLDYAGSMARWCRRHFAAPGLEFAAGDARRLPFPAASFDAVICVELTHCLPDKAAFFREAARVLRPGGFLLVADFFYNRPDAMHALVKFRAALATSTFVISLEEDLTAGVKAALQADAGRRDEMIRSSVPAPFRKLAHYFGGTTESSTYAALSSGRAVYLRFVLHRASDPKQ